MLWTPAKIVVFALKWGAIKINLHIFLREWNFYSNILWKWKYGNWKYPIHWVLEIRLGYLCRVDQVDLPYLTHLTLLTVSKRPQKWVFGPLKWRRIYIWYNWTSFVPANLMNKSTITQSGGRCAEVHQPGLCLLIMLILCWPLPPVRIWRRIR